MIFSPEENAEYKREAEANREIETQRAMWINGQPNRYFALKYPYQAYPQASGDVI